MNSELAAQLTLAAYMLVAFVIVWRQAVHCEHGFQVWMLYVVCRLYCISRFHCRANRRCPFPDDGPALIVANHRSPVDPMLLWMNHHLAGSRYRIRAINFLMAREFYEVRSFWWMYRALRSIPVDREANESAPVRTAIRRLQAGELLGVFPEGRINTGDGLLQPGVGVAFLALKTRAPVYPVFIHNSPQGNGMVGSFLMCSRVRLTYGDPIDLSEYDGRRKSHELLEEVTGRLMSRLLELRRR